MPLSYVLCGSHHKKFHRRQGIESSGVSLKKLPFWVRTLRHASFCFSSIFSWTFLNQITLLCDSMALYFSHYVYIECATITAAVNQKGTKNGFVLCMREIMRTLARIFSGPMWRKCHVQYKLNNKVCYVLTLHITRANCRSIYSTGDSHSVNTSILLYSKTSPYRIEISQKLVQLWCSNFGFKQFPHTVNCLRNVKKFREGECQISFFFVLKWHGIALGGVRRCLPITCILSSSLVNDFSWSLASS